MEVPTAFTAAVLDFLQRARTIELQGVNRGASEVAKLVEGRGDRV
jgi:hypothetical protein